MSAVRWWLAHTDPDGDLAVVVVQAVACVLHADRWDLAVRVLDALLEEDDTDRAGEDVDAERTAAVLDVLLADGLRRGPDFVVVEHRDDGVRVCVRGSIPVGLTAPDGSTTTPDGRARPWSDTTTAGPVATRIGVPVEGASPARLVSGLVRARGLERPIAVTTEVQPVPSVQPVPHVQPAQPVPQVPPPAPTTIPAPAPGVDDEMEDSVAGLGTFYSELLASGGTGATPTAAMDPHLPTTPPENVEPEPRPEPETPAGRPAGQASHDETIHGYEPTGGQEPPRRPDPEPPPVDRDGNGPLISAVPVFGGATPVSRTPAATVPGAVPERPPVASPLHAPSPPPAQQAATADEDDDATIDRAALRDRSLADTTPTHLTLRLPDGRSITVDRPLVLGRSPRADKVPGGAVPHVVRLVDPSTSVSGTHLEVRPDAGVVRARDLGSSNGTVLDRPGAPPVRLGDEPVMITPGCVLTLAEVFVITCQEPDS